MKLLLDTHVLLWWLEDDDGLAAGARLAIADPSNDVFVSAATIWELAIKSGLGKLKLPTDIETLLEEEFFTSLPISFQHAITAGSLPPHHQDPFDRMLIAQAITEGLMLVSRDSRVHAYGVPMITA